METFGDRLRDAIKTWSPRDGQKPSIRHFQRLMEKAHGGKKRFGVSYPAINSYLQGKPEPSIAWVRAASEILAVSPAWLSSGEGPKVGTRRTLGVAFDALIVDPFGDALRKHGPAMGTSPVASAMLEDLAREYVGQMEGEHLVEFAEQMVQDLVWLVGLPMKLWGFRRDLDSSTDQAYRLSMMLTLRSLLRPERGHSSPEEYRGSLIHKLRDAVEEWEPDRDQEEES